MSTETIIRWGGGGSAKVIKPLAKEGWAGKIDSTETI